MKKKYKIMGWDPGFTNAAYSVGDWDIRTGRMHFTHVGTVKSTAYAGRVAQAKMVEKFGRRTVCLLYVAKIIDEQLKKRQPDFVVCEGTYFDRGKPNAYAALLQWIAMIKVVGYQNNMPVENMVARTAKSVVTSYGAASKGDMRSALISAPIVTCNDRINIAKLSQDEVDSMGVSLAFCMKTLVDEKSIKALLQRGEPDA